MADLFSLTQQVLESGSHGALIIIGVSIWKLDRRVLRLELKMNQMRGLV